MRIERNELLSVLPEALDCVEKDVFGATLHHAKRVAWMCLELGKKAGMTEEECSDLAVAALLHDNALIQYKGDYEDGVLRQGKSGREHCAVGEQQIRMIPGTKRLRGFVCYHHERADGTGAFGKTEAETPYGAQLIHITDEVDVKFGFGTADCDTADAVRTFVQENKGKDFGTGVSALFLETFSEDWFTVLADEHVEKLQLDIPPVWIELSRGLDDSREAGIYSLASLFARIIDYKSPFTMAHSSGVAEKAAEMAKHYSFSKAETAECYLAGALHDIGKLLVNSEVLEKPGRLDEREHKHIQTHAWETWRLLSKIEGFSGITDMASYHHEKLNGTGYPFGKTAQQLDRKARMMACLDIYQALTEDRPYKAGMTHRKAILILREMEEKGELDGEIISDIDEVFGGETKGLEEDTERMALFECSVCGHIYEGDVMEPGYVCPVCGQPDSAFQRIL